MLMANVECMNECEHKIRNQNHKFNWKKCRSSCIDTHCTMCHNKKKKKTCWAWRQRTKKKANVQCRIHFLYILNHFLGSTTLRIVWFLLLLLFYRILYSNLNAKWWKCSNIFGDIKLSIKFFTSKHISLNTHIFFSTILNNNLLRISFLFKCVIVDFLGGRENINSFLKKKKMLLKNDFYFEALMISIFYRCAWVSEWVCAAVVNGSVDLAKVHYTVGRLILRTKSTGVVR